ncbi:hypothetical protein R5R73_04940 [Salinicola sp. LHM]|uniref:hypothetical protein n=1 Tax=Salinicola sp. LHM TaxID=3065298 RepID=UPI002ACE92B9|nr:hypothetical protein [Salinicola sp. LHM]WQH34036.1 hypothetical protein R5R73_04940 [Salinicola sp. LHM]
MFQIQSITDIVVPVTIEVPGAKEPSTIRARWRLNSVSKTQEIVQAQRDKENPLTDDQLVEQDLLGLEDVTDADGNPVSFSTELVAQLMDIPYVRRPLVLSWFQAQAGRGEAAAKN